MRKTLNKVIELCDSIIAYTSVESCYSVRATQIKAEVNELLSDLNYFALDMNNERMSQAEQDDATLLIEQLEDSVNYTFEEVVAKNSGEAHDQIGMYHSDFD